MSCFETQEISFLANRGTEPFLCPKFESPKNLLYQSLHFLIDFEVMMPGVVGKKDYCRFSSWISKQGGEKSNFLKCLRKVIADELPHAGRGGEPT